MAEMILFPDVTAAVIEAVKLKLVGQGETADVFLAVPIPRPAKFVTIQRVGGVRRNLVVDEATLSIEAWGGDEGEAADLAQLTRAAVHSLVGTSTDAGMIARTGEFAGPASLPDPASDQARYTMTLTVAVKGTVV